MISGIHIILTYICNYECDHCFVYGGPQAKGTFTLGQLESVMSEIEKIKSIEWIYFEGGEPFLFYPLLIEGLRMAHELGYKTGVVTNGYWAISERDAELWLKPMHQTGISSLDISDDMFHSDDGRSETTDFAVIIAKRLSIPVGNIYIQKPAIKVKDGNKKSRGEPIVGGEVKFRGRAVEKLSKGLLLKNWESFHECPYEDLANPKRVHLDPYGNTHICQGISIGNFWELPLSVIIGSYNVNSHPICQPLFNGGPTLLAMKYGLPEQKEYADACHLCYKARSELLYRYPEYLTPRQLYGLD